MKKILLALFLVLALTLPAYATAEGIELELADEAPDETALEIEDALVIDEMSPDEIIVPDAVELDSLDIESLELEDEGEAPQTGNETVPNEEGDFEIDENGVLVKYNGKGGDVVIPDGVTSIGDKAFEFCRLTSVTIPNSVTSIGEWAFHLCYSLTNFTIPNSVTSIGASAFEECTGLTSVTISNGVISIGDKAFRYCRGLTSISIPNSVTNIGNEAFSGCYRMTDITISSSVKSIGNKALTDCAHLIEISVDPKNNYYASSEGMLFTHDMKTLLCCAGGKTSVTIPNSVTSIGVSAFEYCDNLSSVTIPNSVSLIEDSAFNSCRYMTSVSIPDSVTSIGNKAFYDCYILRNISIPNSVTYIGESAFRNCYSLTSITIPDSITSIENGTFSCSKLTSVTIPNSVTSIGDHAFECTYLTSVTIPNSVTSIGKWTFSNCDSLSSITIPDSVKSIGENAFFHCDKLTIYGKVGSYAEAYAKNNSIPFNAVKFSISDCAITVKDQTYTGKAVKPTVTVKDGEAKLVQDTDYTVAYKSNKNVGTATVTITGKGDYTGTATATFKIVAVKASKLTCTVKDQAYTGKALKPAVTVKFGTTKLKKGTDYTVTYKNNKAVGTATATIKGKGNFTGTAKATFKINPKKLAVSKLTAGKQQLTVKWKKQTGVTGYQIEYSLNKSFKSSKKVTVKKAKTTSATIKSLTGGKKYYVRIRAYKVVKKKTYYSAWSAAKNATVKK